MFLTPVLPSRAGNGLAMRAELFARGLTQKHRVEVRVVSRAQPDDLRELIADPRARERLVALHPLPALAAGFGAGAARELAGEAQRFDVVHVFRLYLAPLLDALLEAPRRPRISLDLDDLDVDLLTALGQGEQAEAFRRLESYYVPRVDAVCVASPSDVAVLAERTGVTRARCIPNAVEVPAALEEDLARDDLLFVGNLSYAPNADAAGWLCDEVLPLLRGVNVTIAGHAPPAAVIALGKREGVRVIADPPDVTPLYGNARVAVVPLRIGAGTPIKALEALAHSRALVATSVGAAGLPSGVAAVADDAAGFAAHCRALLADRELRRELARAGYAYVRAERGVDVVAETIADWASSILAP